MVWPLFLPFGCLQAKVPSEGAKHFVPDASYRSVRSAMRLSLSLLLLATLATSPALAGPCPTRPSWPTKQWPSKPVDLSAKASEVKALEDFAFTLQLPDAARTGLRTDGLVLVKGGAVIYERYARGYGAESKHLSWSVAKSITSALTGVAVEKKALSLDDSICDQLAEYRGRDVCRVHVGHPLTFASGLKWQETYEDAPYQQSSVIAMLFGVGHRDQLAHILGGGLAAEPGARWNYSTGDAELLSAVVKRALDGRFGPDAFWSQLFEPVGMDVVVEQDPRGTPLGGSHLYATPRDFAKLGWLYLNDGCWDGRRLLPEGWVKATTTPSEAFVASAPDGERTPTGYAWWLNARVPSRGHPKPWPDAPDDAYAAEGHWGQLVIVIPSEDLVIVRTGDDRENELSDDVAGQNTLIALARAVAR